MAVTFCVKPGSAGMIVFTFADTTANEFVDLAAFTFKTTDDLANHWGKIPAAGTKDTAFSADLYNAADDLEDDRLITAEVIETITGRRIADLIAEGRKALAEFYAASKPSNARERR